MFDVKATFLKYCLKSFEKNFENIHPHDAVTFSRMTFSRMTLSIMTVKITTFRIMTFSITTHIS